MRGKLCDVYHVYGVLASETLSNRVDLRVFSCVATYLPTNSLGAFLLSFFFPRVKLCLFIPYLTYKRD